MHVFIAAVLLREGLLHNEFYIYKITYNYVTSAYVRNILVPFAAEMLHLALPLTEKKAPY